MINFTVDDIVPCLKETITGDLYDTEVIRIRRKSILSKYNQHTGWYVNWSRFPSDVEVYALVLKGTNNVQGMIAVQYNEDAQGVYVVWACTAPQNNVHEFHQQRFLGVGGHLLAIASDLSVQHGYDGYIYAEAANRDLFEYYSKEFGAVTLPAINNPYRFMLTAQATLRLREVYSYEWTDDII